MSDEKTIRLECHCGEVLIVASGMIASAMTEEKLREIASLKGWTIDPTECPDCQHKHTR